MTLSAYSLEQDKSFPVTDGLSDVSEPVFDAAASTSTSSARPTPAGAHWFAQSTPTAGARATIYLVVLRKDVPSPLAKESDEEKAAAGPRQADEAGGRRHDTRSEARRRRCASTSTGIDSASSPAVPAGDLSNLQAGDAGSGLLPARRSGTAAVRRDRAAPHVAAAPLRPRPSARPSSFSTASLPIDLTADAKKLLYAHRRRLLVDRTAAPGEASTPAEGRLNVGGDLEVRIDPRAEWEQIFDEAWRINRDYFYAPEHARRRLAGDEEEVRRVLPHVATRSDLNRVIRWMSSELAVGHHTRRRRRSPREQDGPRRPARRGLRASPTAATASRRSTAA